MSITFNSKNPAEFFFGNKAVAAIYRGATLVWQKIQKLLKGGYGGGKPNCYVVIPPSDIVLTDVSVLAVWNNTSDCNIKIINECGICIASSNVNGIESDYTKYGFTGWLNTVSSLGTITLYAGNKYYINTKKNGDGEWSIAEYDGETSYYKSCGDIANQMSVDQSAGSRKCYGSCTSFDDIKSVGANGYFIWRGPVIGNNMKPNEDGSGNPYPYLLNRDMSRVKHIFTDSEFSNVPVGSYNDDMARYAYIYYIMGTIEGDEFIMNTSHWNQGFSIGGETIFNNNMQKIYRLTGSMGVNHINSMTPVTEEPANKEQWAIYYKANVAWSSGPSERAVVAWNGSSWEYAKTWSAEWTADNTYDVTNYVTKIDQWTAKDFNKISEQTGSKFYFKLNNIEV